MAASLALGGVSGCAVEPAESIVPYVEQPEQIVPGKPLFFATAIAIDGFGLGVLVESHMGRPTKIEGNPDHPASLGATDAFAQAAILDALRPRPLAGRDHGRPRRDLGCISRRCSWACASEAREPKGAGLRILTRDGDLADAGRPAPPAARAVPRGEVARLRAGHARRRPGRHELAFGEDARAGLSPRQGRRDPGRARRRLPRVGPGPAQGRAGVRGAREVEPQVREFITGRAEQGAQARRR